MYRLYYQASPASQQPTREDATRLYASSSKVGRGVVSIAPFSAFSRGVDSIVKWGIGNREARHEGRGRVCFVCRCWTRPHDEAMTARRKRSSSIPLARSRRRIDMTDLPPAACCLLPWRNDIDETACFISFECETLSETGAPFKSRLDQVQKSDKCFRSDVARADISDLA